MSRDRPLDLTRAVIDDDLDAIQQAARAGVDLSSLTAPGGSLFAWAAEWGRKKIVEYMLDEGVEPDPMALAIAAGRGHTATVRLLVARGLDPDQPSGYPPLCAAADQCYPECVRVLLEAGADREARMAPGEDRWSGKRPSELAALRKSERPDLRERAAEVLRLLGDWAPA